MSVLIKDMEMPENCSDCPVALSGKYCRINKTHTTYTKLPIRPDHCPLVALPDHHGRLVDADATIKEIKARNPDDVSYEDAWAITCIEHAPSIVEAEGENADHN